MFTLFGHISHFYYQLFVYPKNGIDVHHFKLLHFFFLNMNQVLFYCET